MKKKMASECGEKYQCIKMSKILVKHWWKGGAR